MLGTSLFNLNIELDEWARLCPLFKTWNMKRFLFILICLTAKAQGFHQPQPKATKSATLQTLLGFYPLCGTFIHRHRDNTNLAIYRFWSLAYIFRISPPFLPAHQTWLELFLYLLHCEPLSSAVHIHRKMT